MWCSLGRTRDSKEPLQGKVTPYLETPQAPAVGALCHSPVSRACSVRACLKSSGCSRNLTVPWGGWQGSTAAPCMASMQLICLVARSAQLEVKSADTVSVLLLAAPAPKKPSPKAMSLQTTVIQSKADPDSLWYNTLTQFFRFSFQPTRKRTVQSWCACALRFDFMHAITWGTILHFPTEGSATPKLLCELTCCSCKDDWPGYTTKQLRISGGGHTGSSWYRVIRQGPCVRRSSP
jgi:hypothetical protein